MKKMVISTNLKFEKYDYEVWTAVFLFLFSLGHETQREIFDVWFVVLCTLNIFISNLVVKACRLKFFTVVNRVET